jgi:hypothetical protein
MFIMYRSSSNKELDQVLVNQYWLGFTQGILAVSVGITLGSILVNIYNKIDT